jgi:outer membrane lipoprotein carrier protein
LNLTHRIRLRISGLCAAVLLFCASAGAQPDVHAVANAVDRHYNHLQSLEAHFTETYRGAGVTREESGTLLLKRPGRMRWEYTQPKAKLFVTNGKKAWFYVPGEPQAHQSRLRDLDDLRSPLAYLLGKTRLEKEFAALSLAPDLPPEQSGNSVLRGLPKFMPQVSLVLFEVNSSGEIARIVAEYEDGSRMEYRFSDTRENVPIAESVFQFSAPPGVDVVEEEAVD